jgi:HemY protein
LQARAGRWYEAEATLAEAVKRKALPPENSRRHRAVLLQERSRAAESEGETRQALAHAAKAHALDPGFVPASLRYAQLLRVSGRARRAAKVIETGWRASPHPDLAAAWTALVPDETALARFKRVDRLAAARPEHVESHLAQAQAALEARLWGEARRHLETAGAKPGTGADPSPRVCRLMAALEEAEHGDGTAARAWLARATATSALDPSWVCATCGAAHAAWMPVCTACRSFNTLDWRTPSAGAARRTPAPAIGLMPPLPVPVPPRLPASPGV